MLKKVLGLSVIALGVFLEVMWLGVCFGTIIIGIVLLIFAPSILFFPFNFFLVLGLAIMNGTPLGESTQFEYKSYSENKQNNFARATSDISKYYEVLESKNTDSFDVIKANYRRLVKQYHYDSIASKDLPEEMVKFAEQKTKEINEAYSALKNLKK